MSSRKVAFVRVWDAGGTMIKFVVMNAQRMSAKEMQYSALIQTKHECRFQDRRWFKASKPFGVHDEI